MTMLRTLVAIPALLIAGAAYTGTADARSHHHHHKQYHHKQHNHRPHHARKADVEEQEDAALVEEQGNYCTDITELIAEVDEAEPGTEWYRSDEGEEQPLTSAEMLSALTEEQVSLCGQNAEAGASISP